jgi:S-adenosylmethionine decarboxylase
MPGQIQEERQGMKKNKTYGYELVMDLYGCDIDVISSKKKLKEYIDTLCPLIKMKPFGKTLIPYFGDNAAYTKGYSLVQLIETSSITGHFSELWKTAYINIFSCRVYDEEKAKKFTIEFFKAKKSKVRFIVR